MKTKLKNRHVVKMQGEAFKKLHEILARVKETNPKETYISLLSKMVDSFELLSEGDPVYLTGDLRFSKLSEARGEAILNAARAGLEEIEWPDVAVIIGKDDGK